MTKRIIFIALVLFLPINHLFAELSLEEKRSQAMEKELAKVMAKRHKIMEETLSGLAKKKQKEQFFFIRSLELALNLLKQKKIALA